jgi:hypothetical protein
VTHDLKIAGGAGLPNWALSRLVWDGDRIGGGAEFEGHSVGSRLTGDFPLDS